MIVEERKTKNQRTLEITLILLGVGLSCLFHVLTGDKMVVLNLFFLPIVLAGFFLGRYRAGVLALLCVISVSAIASFNLENFVPVSSPLTIALSITLWGCVLGLTALLVGTLSDENSAVISDLQESNLGVVDVLSNYLRGANPRLKDRANRVAELAQRVGKQLKATPQQIDDIRVAALLQDVSNLEITAKVIRKAVGTLESEQNGQDTHTFDGSELIQSLSSALAGAFPLLLNQSGDAEALNLNDEEPGHDIPLGARIIHTVRAFDNAVHSDWGSSQVTPEEAIEDLRADTSHDELVIQALETALSEDSADTDTPADATEPVGAI